MAERWATIMAETLLTHQNGIRLAVFALVLAVMLLWEAVAPRRARAAPRRRRWPGNLGMVLIGGLAVRIVFPVTAVAWAATIEGRGIGVLPAVGIPAWAAVPAAVVLLDLIIWAQHVVFHRVPVLWRLHRMHHADTDLDVTSGTRFHPLEILLSMAIKFAAIAALGAPTVAVLIFEILLNGCAMFNHANAAIPARAEAWLRHLLVTPDMHRIHHSWRRDETDSNFGFCLPWWDRLFGTYRAVPADGQTGMTIGLAEFRDPPEARLDRMLTQPFRASASQAASAP
jgi:sterol desaturase/sphingolipid hydroxylase (fatty acid hydroxylase superfamily)